MVVRFWPGHLGTKPDALTRRPDLYLKGEGKDYGMVNPQNFCSIFSSEQLSASLHATCLMPTVLQPITVMDIQGLHKDILSTYATDPTVAQYLRLHCELL